LVPDRSLKVAAVAQLWFQFVGEGRPFRVVATMLPMDQEYWRSHPERFQEYDVVILEKDHPYLEFAELRNRRITTFRDAGWEYWICQKP
jgi:hypothetical protein